MRVLHINKFLYRRGGAEAYMLDVAAMQHERGDATDFYAMDHPDNIPSRYAGHFPSHLEMNPLPPGVAGKMKGAGRMMWSVSARRGLAEVIAGFRPDVAHLHNVYHQLSPSILAALRTAKVPTVMTLHDYKLVCPSYTMLAHGRPCTACVSGGLRQAVARRCKGGSLPASAAVAAETWLHRRLGAYDQVTVFICPSRFLAERLTEAEVYRDRLQVLDHFVQAPAHAAPSGSDPGGRLLAAGRLSAEKGVDTAIRAAALLPDGVRLDIAGDGPERQALERLAEDVAPGRVTFHGRLPRHEVEALMRSAAALLVPSRWFENQPMIILEGFACGVPVVSTPLGGIPELITDGVSGRLVPPDEPAALAAAAHGYVGDASARRSAGEAARRIAAERFSPERHLAGLDELYARAGAPGPL
ncbi:glycosyltransferase family 4 protein [Actinomadura soli]|uniref:Glycosyltransferase family 4 protein n=1 Tax=Actinomadura soli TaxID=2508997 RepID=A0A5C4J4H0_9ACTN|nr:glycosyltransferase family 4 protein [Actinomadura soli]TMQ91779.1 glycosyltransferase family 4 protein [Actinomadura soli]